MASASYAKLRRLAPRSIRVLARRAGESPAIAAFAPTLESKAREYMTAFDASKNYQRIYEKETSEGHSAVAVLKKKMSVWAPSLARDIPSFDPSDALERGSVPDDVISAGETMIQVIEDAAKAGTALPYGSAILGELEAAVTEASKEWAEAEASNKARQERLKTTREKGALFDAELQLLRRVLAAHAGRSDADYQKLRTEKALQSDPDDDGDLADETLPGKKSPVLT